ncbi:MAG: response regulator [Pseudomonadota bacterium]|nr:response regulator [Pseudomonadota bacterium]
MIHDVDMARDETVKTVLVIDDMQANRAVMQRQLELAKYAVLTVESGAQALDLLATSHPDIILLDYMMPEMNGVEFLKRLRDNPKTQHLPVIMVTARVETEATVEALAAGADDYVTKPIDFSGLKARIERHLELRGDAADLERSNAALDERVTMRSLLLADMETELQKEIAKRKELESEIEALRRTSVPSDGAVPKEWIAIRSQFDTIFESALAGRMPNMAQMYSLREALAKLTAKDG